MRPNKLRQLLNDDKPSVGTHVMTVSPDVVEIIGKTGLIDYIEFVAEYAPYSLTELDNFGRALEIGGMSGMIKVDRENRGWVAQRALGSGFQNVLFSDVHDAAEAEECVAIVRAESPQTKGHFGSADRRFASYGLESGSPEYVQALEESVVALMIEKDEAVKNLDAILSVPGVDMIVFGGNDYSMSLGRPRAVSPEEIAEVRTHIFKSALAKGIQPRSEISEPEQAKDQLEMGVKHYAIGTDLFMIYQWVNERAGGLREILG
jgi:4-hydroxy-2-oxoheptanedioate aldolase